MTTESGAQGEHIVDILLRAYEQAGSPEAGQFIAGPDIYGRQQTHWFKYGWNVDKVFGLGIELDQRAARDAVKVIARVEVPA